MSIVNVDGVEFLIEYKGDMITARNKEIDATFLYKHTHAIDVKTTQIDKIGFSNYNGNIHYQFIYVFLIEQKKNKKPKEIKIFLKNSYRYEYDIDNDPDTFSLDTETHTRYMLRNDCFKVKVETNETLMGMRITQHLLQRKTDAEIKELRDKVAEISAKLSKLTTNAN